MDETGEGTLGETPQQKPPTSWFSLMRKDPSEMVLLSIYNSASYIKQID